MTLRRSLLLCLAALILPACGKRSTTIIQNTAGGPGGGTGLFFTLPAAPAGTSGLDDTPVGFDAGSDGQPRLVYLTGTTGVTANQLLLTRRDASGTWSAPVPVSANDTDTKSPVFVFVSRNNNFTHAVWIETPVAVFDPRVHYAQFNNDPTPAATVADTEISNGATANVPVGSTFDDVFELTAAIDRATNNVYALWVQDVIIPAVAVNRLPIVGLVAAGAGPFTERFSLMTAPVANANAASARLAITPTGEAHAAWLASAPTVVRHRMRTGPAAWSSGPDGQNVSTFAAGTASNPALAVAADGDAYLFWLRPAFSELNAAYRPAGAGSAFGAPSLVAGVAAAAAPRLVALTEPGTEFLHVFWGDGAFVGTVHQPAANLSGSWNPMETVHGVAANPGDALDFVVWSDSTNRVACVILAPRVANDLSHVQIRTRPTGGASAYTPPVDLTAPFALPCAALAVGTNAAGDALIAWVQGDPHAIPLADLFAVQYTRGGALAGPVNVSDSPSLGSHGPVLSGLTDSNVGHLFWAETTTAAPGRHDTYHAQKP